MQPLRILIVDDHDAVRRGLRALLSSRSEWSVCGEATDGVDAVEKTKELRPDLVLMDISMPRMDGIEATRIIRKQVPGSKVVLVSQNDPALVRPRALEVDAHGYVSKSNLARDLVSWIEQLGDGQPGRQAPAPVPRRQAGEWLSGGGILGQLIREHDWSRTPLGPIQKWPQSLRTAVNLMLNSQHPMWIGWGPQMTFLYNDAYISVLSLAKHPGSLGRPAKEVWAEIWNVCGPLADKVFAKGEPSYADEVRLFMSRGDFLEETYYSFSYSPIYDEAGKVGGLFCPSTETTAKVLHTRRLHTLSELSAKALVEKSVEAACASTCATLAQNLDDIPFSLLYLLSDDGKRARLQGSSGISAAANTAGLLEIDLGNSSTTLPWEIEEVFRTSEPRVIAVPEGISLPSGPANQPVKEALVLPLAASGQDQLIGVLIAAINPTRKLDTEHRTFFQLVADQLVTAIQNAKVAEEEKRRADALAEIDRAKTVFFSNVSHEFRTPLTLMLGPLEDMLANSAAFSGPDRERLNVAHRNSLRLLKLVNTLLDFSRIESGRLHAAHEPTDLAALTSDLASVFRSTTERAGLRLVIDCPGLDAPVPVDREMWEKIVFNLLSNAFKFTLSGEIRVALRQTGEMVELRVSDTGTGIPAEELPHLFERFHRVKGARGRTFEGSGIGLALVQELARVHGGSVCVESEVDKGSTFIVAIPASPARSLVGPAAKSPAAAVPGRSGEAYVEEALRWLPDLREEEGATPTPVAPTAGPRKRVLLADDNADMREYLRRLLASRYEVEAVADGAQALEAALRHLPDLVLTDVMMPKVDGFALLKALRGDPRTASVPVVLLSARAGEESRVEGISAGADDYLIKPFSARELMARVDTHLQLSALRRDRETQARDSEQYFRQVIDAFPVAIYTTDADGRLTHFNSAAVTFSGRTPELGTERWCVSWKIFLPDGTPLRHEDCPMAVAIREGRVSDGGEFIAERPDGSRAWFTPYPRPLRDANGNIIGGVNMLVDITERKQAEQALLESHALRQTAMDAGRLGAWDWDVAQNKVTWTERVYEIHGLKPGTFGGTVEAFSALVHPEDLPTVRQAIERALSGEASYKIEFRIVRPSGEVRWLFTRAEVTRDASGAPVRMTGITQDVTERKQAEQATGLLVAIVNSSDDAIVSKNLDGIITSWNKGAEKLFGYSAEEAVGRHITLIIPPDRRREEVMIIDRIRRGEPVDHFETVRVRKNGTLVNISLAISPVRDASGRVVGASKVARDITERKRVERVLAQGAKQQQALFHLADRLNRAISVDEIYSAALDAIFGALQCDRASILVYDNNLVMRFVSWRGLSEEYRRVTEGHSPWKPDAVAPQPICMNDLDSAPLEEPLKTTVKNEGIAALAFIPLVSRGRLIGKFMTYFNSPRALTEDEIEFSLTIARQLAFAIERKRGDEALRQSEERFRKLAETLDAEVRLRTLELEERNADVVRQSERLRDLSQRLMQSRDDERRHIARELHDSAGQTLTVLGMNLARVAQEAEHNSPELLKDTKEAQALVLQLNQEIRTMSYLLHPPLLDESGLSAALSWYVRGLSERSGLDIALEIPEDFGRLPRELELVVFRLVQECLTNVHRHSESKSASIQVARDAENVFLEIQDRGKGMSPERLMEIQAHGSGVGLRGMRERVRQFDGQLNIESNESGTKVSVILPLPESYSLLEDSTIEAFPAD